MTVTDGGIVKAADPPLIAMATHISHTFLVNISGKNKVLSKYVFTLILAFG
jgi:hypothetical protein